MYYMTRLITSWRMVLGVLLLLLSAHGASAQLVKEREAPEKQESDAIRTFFDRSKPIEQRLLAAERMGYPDDATMSRLLAIGIDATENDAVRWEALRRLRNTDGNLDVFLKILEDPSNGDETLGSNLIKDATRRVMFKPASKARQRWQTVMRKLLEDPRGAVRLQAYRVLVAHHDVAAIKRISSGLAEKGGIPVPLPDAIRLLNETGATNHLAALRPYLVHADPKVQAQAVNALAADRESQPKIIAMARDPQTPREVRISALAALAREDEGFAEYAIPIIASAVDAADTDVQVWRETLRAIVGRLNYSQIDAKIHARLTEVLRGIANGQAGGGKVDLSADAEKVLQHLKRIVPEIKNLNGAK